MALPCGESEAARLFSALMEEPRTLPWCFAYVEGDPPPGFRV